VFKPEIQKCKNCIFYIYITEALTDYQYVYSN